MRDRRILRTDEKVHVHWFQDESDVVVQIVRKSCQQIFALIDHIPLIISHPSFAERPHGQP